LIEWVKHLWLCSHVFNLTCGHCLDLPSHCILYFICLSVTVIITQEPSFDRHCSWKIELTLIFKQGGKAISHYNKIFDKLTVVSGVVPDLYHTVIITQEPLFDRHHSWKNRANSYLQAGREGHLSLQQDLLSAYLRCRCRSRFISHGHNYTRAIVRPTSKLKK
jgi:hypothetical protein